MSSRSKWELVIGAIVVVLAFGIMVVAIAEVNIRYMMAAYVTPPALAPAAGATQIPADADLVTLRQVVVSQQQQIADLTRSLEAFQEEQREGLIDIRWILDSKLLIGGLLVSVATLLGWGTYRSIDDKVRERIRASIDETIQGYDPSYVPIYFPAGDEYNDLRTRLKNAQLKNVRPYAPGSLIARYGVTVV